jgi:hypothetical protein
MSSRITVEGGSARTPLLANWRAYLTPLAIVMLFGAMLFAALIASPPSNPIRYDLDGAHESGLLGLRLWLEELGYDVRRTGGLRFELPADASLLFVYPNQLTYTAEEAARLRRWVEAGGALALVGPMEEDTALIDAFGVRLNPELRTERQQIQIQPLLPEGRPTYLREWFSSSVTLDLSDAPQAVPVLALTTAAADEEPGVIAETRAVAAVQPVGAGVVWHFIPGVDFTNLYLRSFDQGELLPALLRAVPERGVVVFDAYHLFGLSRVGDQIATLQDWLYRTPTGWATLFALAASAVFLLLHGRRLGPPLVTVQQTRGREAAEYVRAMANLHRRARTHAELAQHHARRLKVGLARRHGVRADLPDAQFLEVLAYTSPSLSDVQIAAVRATLIGLSGNPGEQQLVSLADSVDQILQTIR